LSTPRRRLGTIVVSLAMALSCCGEGGPATQTPDVPPRKVVTFELSIFQGDGCRDLATARSYEEAERIVPTLEVRDPVVTLTLVDIAAYDSDDGALTLTPSAIQRAMRGSGLPLPMAEAVLSEGCFVLAIGGRRLFGGLTLFIGTQRGDDIPTIFPVTSGDTVRLLIRPAIGGVFDRDALHQDDPTILGRIHPDELHDYFASVGRLASP
jgi:hypothetical protein